LENREAAVCLLQGIENVEISAYSMLRCLEKFQQMGHVSQAEIDKVSSALLEAINKIMQDIAEPVLKKHPDLVQRCTSCSAEADSKKSCES